MVGRIVLSSADEVADVGGVALAVMAVSFLVIGGLFGLVTAAILSRTSISRWTAFGWGAALGPVGVAISIGIAASQSQTEAQHEVDGVPW